MHKEGPMLLTGDLNGDAHIFPTICKMTQLMCWCDIGAQADLWGGKPNLPTCKVSSVARETRRDYMFANQWLLPAIMRFRVKYDDTFSHTSTIAVSDCDAKASYEAPHNQATGECSRQS